MIVNLHNIIINKKDISVIILIEYIYKFFIRWCLKYCEKNNKAFFQLLNIIMIVYKKNSKKLI